MNHHTQGRQTFDRDRTYLSGVERSERNVSIDNIARIAKGLKIEPWRLLKND
jgi:transcriptional regulator with XRE-family HTH domain